MSSEFLSSWWDLGRKLSSVCIVLFNFPSIFNMSAYTHIFYIMWYSEVQEEEKNLPILFNTSEAVSCPFGGERRLHSLTLVFSSFLWRFESSSEKSGLEEGEKYGETVRGALFSSWARFYASTDFLYHLQVSQGGLPGWIIQIINYIFVPHKSGCINVE